MQRKISGIFITNTCIQAFKSFNWLTHTPAKKTFNWLNDFAMQSWDNTWVTLWLVTLANHNVTRVQRKKKYYERERRKTLVALWLANVTMSPTTMSPKCYPQS